MAGLDPSQVSIGGAGPSQNAYGNINIGGSAHAVLGDVHINSDRVNEDITTDPKKAKECKISCHLNTRS